MSEKLLSVREAAGRLGLKPTTLYQWAGQRRVPSVKLGSRLFFRESDTNAMIRRNLRPALRELQEVTGQNA